MITNLDGCYCAATPKHLSSLQASGFLVPFSIRDKPWCSIVRGEVALHLNQPIDRTEIFLNAKNEWHEVLPPLEELESVTLPWRDTSWNLRYQTYSSGRTLTEAKYQSIKKGYAAGDMRPTWKHKPRWKRGERIDVFDYSAAAEQVLAMQIEGLKLSCKRKPHDVYSATAECIKANRRAPDFLVPPSLQSTRFDLDGCYCRYTDENANAVAKTYLIEPIGAFASIFGINWIEIKDGKADYTNLRPSGTEVHYKDGKWALGSESSFPKRSEIATVTLEFPHPISGMRIKHTNSEKTLTEELYQKYKKAHETSSFKVTWTLKEVDWDKVFDTATEPFVVKDRHDQSHIIIGKGMKSGRFITAGGKALTLDNTYTLEKTK